mgnify:CR=1 FL=1
MTPQRAISPYVHQLQNVNPPHERIQWLTAHSGCWDLTPVHHAQDHTGSDRRRLGAQHIRTQPHPPSATTALVIRPAALRPDEHHADLGIDRIATHVGNRNRALAIAGGAGRGADSERSRRRKNASPPSNQVRTPSACSP